MSSIKPFRALRPQPQLAKQVASRPYDVLSSAEAKQEAWATTVHSCILLKVRLIFLIQLIHMMQPYEQAKENLAAFMQRDILFRESKECYYIYQLIMNGRSQTGLVCISSVDDYENGIIKKHEFTRPEKEQDRINHIKISGAQTGNVFLAYRNHPAIDALISQWKETKSPVYDFTADDGIQHTVWIVNNDTMADQITELFEKEIPCTYIADGHHRAASAAKVRNALGETATAGAGYFLTTLFPSNQLFIMDYNRAVKDLNGLTPKNFIKELGKLFSVELVSQHAYRPEALHTFGLYLDHNWYKLTNRNIHHRPYWCALSDYSKNNVDNY